VDKVVTGSSEVLWVIPLKKVWHYTFYAENCLQFVEETPVTLPLICCETFNL
jgi:hypothetical protein